MLKYRRGEREVKQDKVIKHAHFTLLLSSVSEAVTIKTKF